MAAALGIIYYDGLCKACSMEMNHYRRLPGSETFNFVDITEPDFDPATHGLDPFKVHKVMHVRDASGALHEGVDAFRAIWKQIPRYHFMVKLSENYFFRRVLEGGYQVFIKIRPYLPRKKADCSNSPYCEVTK